MGERLNRHKREVAILLSSLAITACGESRNRLLNEGENIHSINVYTPTSGVQQTKEWFPRQTEIAEDLVVIHVPSYSEVLEKELPSIGPNSEFGILFTTSNTGIFRRLIAFDEKTQNVNALHIGTPMIKDERLLTSVDSRGDTITVDVSVLPGKSPGIKISVNQPQIFGPMPIPDSGSSPTTK